MEDNTVSLIKIDYTRTGENIRKVWNMGFNTCHAPLLLRDDLWDHAKKGRDLGFKYIRFHSNFSEKIGIYNEDSDGKPIYNFEKLDIIYDKIIGSGLLPFFEISFCPELLKKTDSDICFYKACTSIPKSYEKWDALIKALIIHVIERYGLNCVKNWYFEVWNEPDLIFFDGEIDDYFELYDHTVAAIKGVKEELHVGGPATSKCEWISEFIKHIEEGSKITNFERVPCDFISTHAYPSDLPFLNNANGSVKLQNSSVLNELYKSVRNKMNNSSLRLLPLIMGEWNSSAGPYAYNHDEKNNAAFIVKTMLELKDTIDGSLFWNLTDIYEECGFHYTPFHGGYGIMNVNSIPKSSYNAFKLLNEMNGRELELVVSNSELPQGCGILATYDNSKEQVNILIYNYIEPDSIDFKPWTLKLEVKSIHKESIAYKSQAINDNSGSPYEWWRAIGSPDYLTVDTIQLLSKKSDMEIVEKVIFMEKDRKVYSLEELLMPGDIKLIQVYL